MQLRVSRRKAAYTATQRMICHINIISEVATLAAPSAEPLTASIKDCAELRVDTSILNITFPQDRASIPQHLVPFFYIGVFFMQNRIMERKGGDSVGIVGNQGTEKASCDQTSCFLSAASLFTMSCDLVTHSYPYA